MWRGLMSDNFGRGYQEGWAACCEEIASALGMTTNRLHLDRPASRRSMNSEIVRNLTRRLESGETIEPRKQRGGAR